jgi:hypothetical protein
MNANNTTNHVEESNEAPSAHFSTPDPVNHLRVQRDFAHLPPSGLTEFEVIDDVYNELIATSTALEFVMVMFFELEDKQLRSDYLFSLLKPHVTQLINTVEGLSGVMSAMRRA